MKTIICLILVITLALNSIYSKRPQNDKRQSNNLNTQKSYQQVKASESNNYKTGLLTSPYSSSSEKESHILRHDIEINGDGTYYYDFETSNGIKRTEKGAVDGSIQGFSSYISPDGIEIKTTYIADENGYHPVGDHIPRIPDYIVRALEYIRDHPYIEKDYYTGEVKKVSMSNNQPLITTNKHRSAYNKIKKSSHSSKNNFRH